MKSEPQEIYYHLNEYTNNFKTDFNLAQSLNEYIKKNSQNF